jgi:hypothetical protein
VKGKDIRDEYLWTRHIIAMVGTHPSQNQLGCTRRAVSPKHYRYTDLWTMCGLSLTRADAIRPYQTLIADLWTRLVIAIVGTRSRSLHTPGCALCPQTMPFTGTWTRCCLALMRASVPLTEFGYPKLTPVASKRSTMRIHRHGIQGNHVNYSPASTGIQ